MKQQELQKKNLKQQFKTASYDIGDKLDVLTKEQLDEIKKKSSQKNPESKLKRSDSQSSPSTKNNWQNEVKRSRSNSAPRSPGS
jgi:G3E family GTPase